WIYRSLESTMEEQLASTLQTVLDADVAALHAWMKDHQNNAALLAGDEHLLPLVRELLAVAEKGGTKEARILALNQAKAQEKLRDLLKPRLETLDYHGFVLISPDSVI